MTPIIERRIQWNGPIIKEHGCSLSAGPNSLCVLSPLGMYTWSSIHDYETTSGLGNNLLHRLRGKQVLEVGPGLAELTPTIARLKGYPPPIIIEPVNLFDIQQLLQNGIENPEFAHHKKMLALLLERAYILTSPNVRWIREKIENIPQTHPELAHLADTVIDVRAGTIYGENYYKVYEIEHEFLRRV